MVVGYHHRKPPYDDSLHLVTLVWHSGWLLAPASEKWCGWMVLVDTVVLFRKVEIILNA